MKQTVLVLGAQSVVAQAVISILQQDVTVITAGRHDCDVFCDVTTGVTIPEGVDVVLNFATSFGGKDGNEVVEAVAANVLGMAHLCAAAQARRVAHVVNISSMFASLDEHDPQFSLYALTKRQGDELAMIYGAAHNLPVTVLRLARVYGDIDAFRKGQPFLYQIIDKAQAGEDVVLYGGKEVRRTYIHVQDVAEILRRVMATKTTGLYTCLHPVEETYTSIAEAAQRIFGKGGDVRMLADKPSPPDDAVPFDGLLYERLHYQPQVAIEDGIRRIMQYRREAL